MITVEDVMTRHPKTLGETESLADARRMMAEFDIRHIPIVDSSGRLLGLVTHRDVLAASSSVLDQTEQQRQGHDSEIEVSTVMSRTLDLVSPGAGLRDAAQLMRNHRLGCLPVMNQDDLIGIITDTDFVEVAIHMLEQLESVEQLEVDDELDELPRGAVIDP